MEGKKTVSLVCYLVSSYIFFFSACGFMFSNMQLVKDQSFWELGISTRRFSYNFYNKEFVRLPFYFRFSCPTAVSVLSSATEHLKSLLSGIRYGPPMALDPWSKNWRDYILEVHSGIALLILYSLCMPFLFPPLFPGFPPHQPMVDMNEKCMILIYEKVTSLVYFGYGEVDGKMIILWLKLHSDFPSYRL